MPNMPSSCLLSRTFCPVSRSLLCVRQHLYASVVHMHMLSHNHGVLAGGYGFVNYLHHSEAVHAIVAMNGHTIGNKAVNCAWGRHQPRQPQAPAVQMLQMQPQIQSPMQSHSQLGYVGGPGMLALMRPMIHMPAGIQMPSQLTNLGVPQVGSPQLAQHAQQALQQQALLSSSLPVGGQLGMPHASQQHMMAAHRAQMDPNSIVYGGMYGSMYGAP